jgi:hypothetical protein
LIHNYAMASFHSFRQTRTLVRGVLLWFVLSLAVAFAAPLVQPVSLGAVCSASATPLAQSDDVVPGTPSAHTVQCSLCLPFTAPPSQFALPVDSIGVPQGTLPWMALGHVAAPVPSALSARGPPAFR